MDKETLNEHQKQLIQIVNGFNSRGTETQRKKAFNEHRQSVLEQIPQMGDVLRPYPEHAAIAFLGRFTFGDCPEVKQLAEVACPQTLSAISAKGAVQLEDDAKEAWFFLKNFDAEIACVVLALCFKVNTHKAVRFFCNGSH